jgi:hypothetical protein
VRCGERVAVLCQQRHPTDQIEMDVIGTRHA